MERKCNPALQVNICQASKNQSSKNERNYFGLKKRIIQNPLYILLRTIYGIKYISSPILAVIGKQGVFALLKAVAAAVIAVGLGLF